MGERPWSLCHSCSLREGQGGQGWRPGQSSYGGFDHDMVNKQEMNSSCLSNNVEISEMRKIETWAEKNCGDWGYPNLAPPHAWCSFCCHNKDASHGVGDVTHMNHHAWLLGASSFLFAVAWHHPDSLLLYFRLRRNSSLNLEKAEIILEENHSSKFPLLKNKSCMERQ